MGDTDTSIMLTIIIIFVFLGAILPFVNAAFNQGATNLNTKGVEFAAGQNLEETSGVGILDVIISIFTMFFWTFGNVPVIMDLIVFVPIRIIFLVILYRNLRGV